MPFYHRVLILDQTANGFSINGKRLSAILRIEREWEGAEGHLSFINFATLYGFTFYALFIFDDQKTFFVPIGDKAKSITFALPHYLDFDKPFCASIFAFDNTLPQLVAFTRENGSHLTPTHAKKVIAEWKIQQNKADEKQRLYDDEAVATENYFDFDKQIKNKMEKIKVNNDLQSENELPAFDGKTQKNKSQTAFDVDKNEKDTCPFKENNLDFYNGARAELEIIFSKFPKENNLSLLFPQSRWAKINYSDDKYYVVGVIKEKGVEKYICYGVPATYSPTPPKALDGYCSFIPLSIFNFKGEGYWMMFQSAKDGSCVKSIDC